MAHVFVTGATGYPGRSLIQLLAHGYRVRGRANPVTLSL